MLQHPGSLPWRSPLVTPPHPAVTVLMAILTSAGVFVWFRLWVAAASCWLSVGTALREERDPACAACIGFLFVAGADDHEPSGLKHQRTTLQFRGPDV